MGTKEEKWLEIETQRCWLNFVASTKPPMDIIDVLEVTWKEGFTEGMRVALSLRRKS